MIRGLALFGAGAAVGAYAALQWDGKVQYMRVPINQPAGPLGMSPEDVDDVLDGYDR